MSTILYTTKRRNGDTGNSEMGPPPPPPPPSQVDLHLCYTILWYQCWVSCCTGSHRWIFTCYSTPYCGISVGVEAGGFACVWRGGASKYSRPPHPLVYLCISLHTLSFHPLHVGILTGFEMFCVYIYFEWNIICLTYTWLNIKKIKKMITWYNCVNGYPSACIHACVCMCVWMHMQECACVWLVGAWMCVGCVCMCECVCIYIYSCIGWLVGICIVERVSCSWSRFIHSLWNKLWCLLLKNDDQLLNQNPFILKLSNIYCLDWTSLSSVSIMKNKNTTVPTLQLVSEIWLATERQTDTHTHTHTHTRTVLVLP